MKNWKRNVYIFIGSQALSSLGSSIVLYSLMWYITLETTSGTMMTLYFLLGLLPMLLIAPFAGVWADRFNRKWMIITADGLIAFVTLLLAIYYFLGYDALWPLFVISAIRAIGMGVQEPAVASIIPQLVPEEQLIKISGIRATINSMIHLMAPMIGMLLLTFMSLEVLFLVDVITATIAITILVFFLKVGKPVRSEEKTYKEDFKEGFNYIRKHQSLKKLFTVMGLLYFFTSPAMFITSLHVARVFGEEVWRLTVMDVVYAVGMSIGGALLAKLGGFKNRLTTMLSATVVVSVAIMLLGIFDYYWFLLIAMFLYGSAMPFINAPATVYIQETIDKTYHGRVFGFYSMIATSMMPFALVIFGPLADIVSTASIFIFSGIILFIVALWMFRIRGQFHNRYNYKSKNSSII